MNRQLGKWRDRLQFTLVFLALTVLVHYAFGWMRVWLDPVDPYKVPEGEAVKVFMTGEPGKETSPLERLKLFFWLGE
ncbi:MULTISPECIES: DUF4227 family protein [Cohnella]|uniref:DUF4227 family protein n=1 Tax=Cohnella TaxID=329857 RepID=UPI0009BC4673|nr:MULTISPECIES: DUF4227 family protein [Cohnella]MBN2984382.1 YqzK family protein [Cohnella algarum]